MIGKRIQQLRLARGLSLSELAERADIAKSYLSAIERNIQGNPSIQVIEKLASVLNVSIQALLGEESSDTPISLDPDWMDLAKEAMNSGVSKEQFREWLEFQRWRIDKEGK
ncbi:helix-turn-helix domain-containing protein [Alicyclobacillus tolerans]|uniref:helix-turn-helix domain-containing protein n=1 Tax=Alicyclobacillus tolerans TaxID=90970 RepID=UPI001F33AC6E|nr:helix-turn-helix domain-containing protein [Alicyclobacillus tolerans]MCF8563944.1 helix-turn-helix domain-containing protein [Alicyclobacillus tolerans]